MSRGDVPRRSKQSRIEDYCKNDPVLILCYRARTIAGQAQAVINIYQLDPKIMLQVQESIRELTAEVERVERLHGNGGSRHG